MLLVLPEALKREGVAYASDLKVVAEHAVFLTAPPSPCAHGRVSTESSDSVSEVDSSGA